MPILFIPGHSDSGADYLDPGQQPWPEQIASWLSEATGRPFELRTKRFFPAGPGAANYFLKVVDESQADAVVIPLSLFTCVVPVVSESVRARFGARAHRLFLRFEGGFQGRTTSSGTGRTANRWARRLARRVLGTRTFASPDEVFAIYSGILAGLAARESILVHVMGDAAFAPELQRREPALVPAIAAFKERIVPLVRQYRFTWSDLEDLVGPARGREQLWLDDGVHTTSLSHDYYARHLRQALTDNGTVARLMG
ncbi:MAG: hypothetical protein ACKVVT_15970 [Dehalococcoidia bacterium]